MSRFTRRELLKIGLLGSGAVVLAACAPKTTAPAPVAEAPAGEAPAQPKAEAPAKAGEVIKLRFITRQGDQGIHHREFAQRYADESGGRIEVEAEDTAWGEISTKLETQLVAGMMPDLAVMSTRDFPYLARRGAFLEIDELAEKENLDLSRWFIIEWFQRWTGGKLSGLGGAAGLSNVLSFYNKDWVVEAWGKEPSDDWTMDEFVECMQACISLKGEGHFGTALAIGGSVEADSWVCNWGGSYLDDTYTVSTFAEENTQDAIRWLREQLANGNLPQREDAAEGAQAMFLAQKMAFNVNNPGASTGMVKGAEAGGFERGVVLSPRGPSAFETPSRYGFCPYANNFAISAKTKYPEESFGLMLRVLSSESFKWRTLQTGAQPGAMMDAWYDPEIVAMFPWFPKTADVMMQCPPYYPVPANTRYNEWADIGNNEIPPLVYGEVEYNNTNVSMVNDHLQEILDLPAPGA
jgi:ABC-type glycerol-3-phosphate transport system substrate-binding protein